MEASTRGWAHYAGAVLAAVGLLARTLGRGALGTVGVAGWIAMKLADRSLGWWVAPHGFPITPGGPGSCCGSGGWGRTRSTRSARGTRRLLA